MTLCHLVPHPHALPLVSPCLAPYEVPFLPLSSDLPQAPRWYPMCTPHGPHRHRCVITLLEPPGHRRWLCQPQPYPLLTAPSPCPPYPPIWALPGRVWRGCKGEWSPSNPRSAVTPAGPPAGPAPALPASGHLAGGRRCAGGPDRHQGAVIAAHLPPTPRAQPPCPSPGLSTLGGPEPLSWGTPDPHRSLSGDGGSICLS